MIVVIIALLTLIGGLVLLTSTGYKSYHFSKDRAQALYLAEGGISSAIREIKGGEEEGSISDATLAYSDNSLAGSYSVEWVLDGSSYTVITSTGMVNKGSDENEVERTVQVTVQVTVEFESTVFDMAAFAGNDDGNGITIDKGVSIDSYDSEGTGQLYVEAEAGNKGDIGTNSISTSPKAVDIDKDSHISGDVYIGQEGVPEEAIDNRGIVDGELLRLDENKNLPEVDPPSPSDFGLSSQDSEGPLVVEEEKEVSSNGWYDSITVEKNGHLTFNPDVTFIYVDGNMSITGTKKEETTVTIATDMTLYVAGEFEINKFAELYIQDNHKLTVYAGGGIELDPKDNSYINNVSKNPLNLVIYGLDTCTKVTIGKHEGFYGAIYAPNASIDVGDVDVYGSIVGDTIKIANNASIHYDEALASVAIPCSSGGDSGSLVPGSWQELSQ